MKTLEAKNGIERSLIRYMKDIADSNPLSSDQ